MPADIVTEEAIEAVARRLSAKYWKADWPWIALDGKGLAGESARFCASKFCEEAEDFLNAAAPLIQKQVEERVRERLLGRKAVEAAGDVPNAFVGHTMICQTAAREVLEAALDSLDQDPEQ